MNQSDQEHFHAILNNWCPKGPAFDNEPMQVRLMRAFMQVSAYAADAARVMSKRDAIRDLDSYPNPLVGFEEIPARVKIKRENIVPGLDAESKTSWAFGNMKHALNLENRGEKSILRVAESIQSGYEKFLDVDSVESNRVFRSKHTRWLLDHYSERIKEIIGSTGSRRFVQLSRIEDVVQAYGLSHPDIKQQMLREALDEAN